MNDASSAPMQPPGPQGLYDPTYEHDACGMGFVAHIKGRKSHDIVQKGLKILVNLTHRGAVGADKLQGDGAGILIQIPDTFLRRECGKLKITLPAVGQYGVGMIFLPQNLPRAWPASRRSSARLQPKVRSCSAGAMCRSIRPASAKA
jgi:glutamate synthase (NADH) large subunit (EC 1.4.1.14)